MKRKLIFEQSVAGRSGYILPKSTVEKKYSFPNELARTHDAALPEVSEMDLVRHFTNLSHLNFSVDTQFYPLGSCTMKYNPRILEKAASLGEFAGLHPMLGELPGGEAHVQGALEVLYELEKTLCEITGMDDFSIQPMAGAHGELAGVMCIAAYHRAKGNAKKYIIVPDSSHGTNPASAAVAGFEVITLASLPNGEMDLEKLKEALNDEVAAIMLTCPNTLGIFETNICEIAAMAHKHDTLLYYDGANLNAILGKVRPGDIGFDVVHVNVHKTFATPHGGGGPGAGPVGVRKKLAEFLPRPRITKNGSVYSIENNLENSIGRLAPFFGNFAILLRAYTYMLILGKEGMLDVSEKAVLNANYIMEKLKSHYALPYDRRCMHEAVFSTTKEQNDNGVHALDIAKFLIDKGVHPPTVYFPLIVKEAMMIEPTETESKETLDDFIALMIEAAECAANNPALMKASPVHASISRPDETKAARELRLKWTR